MLPRERANPRRLLRMPLLSPGDRRNGSRDPFLRLSCSYLRLAASIYLPPNSHGGNNRLLGTRMSTNYHAPTIVIISYLELYRDRNGRSRSSRRHWQRYSASCPNSAEMFTNLTVAIENSVPTGKSSDTQDIAPTPATV